MVRSSLVVAGWANLNTAPQEVRRARRRCNPLDVAIYWGEESATDALVDAGACRALRGGCKAWQRRGHLSVGRWPLSGGRWPQLAEDLAKDARSREMLFKESSTRQLGRCVLVRRPLEPETDMVS